VKAGFFKGSGLVAGLLSAQIFVAIFYGATIFFLSSSGDISNPNIPMEVKASKDLFWAFVVFGLFFLTFCIYRVRAPRAMFLYTLVPLLLFLLDLWISIYKFEIDSEHLGILKNYAMFYFGGGVLVILADRFDAQYTLFTSFRLFMTISVLIGLGFYLLPGESQVSYVYFGRMIATLANPNMLGYLCALHLMLLHGVVYYYGRLSRLEMLEMCVAVAGLIASVSLAAILVFAVAVVLLAALVALRIFPRSGALLKLVGVELAVGLVTLSVFVWIITAMDALSDLNLLYSKAYLHLPSPMDPEVSTSVVARVETFDLVREEVLGSWNGFLFGSSQFGEYIKWDSALVNLLLNYGFFSFALWFSFFSLPVVVTFASRRLLKRHLSQDVCFVFVLSVFLLSSLTTHFWLQYAPETYPTSFFLGWIMAFIMFHVYSVRATHRDSEKWVPEAPLENLAFSKQPAST